MISAEVVLVWVSSTTLIRFLQAWKTQNHALGRLKIHQSLLMHILEVRAFSIEEGFV